MTLSTGNTNLISIADSDGGSQTVDLTASNSGLLTLASTTGITINTGSDGSSAMNISGTLADINAALDGLQYDPNGDVGAQTITISTDDGNGGTDGPDVVNVTVNQTPVITTPGAQTIQSVATLTLSTGNANLISIADADTDAQTVDLTASNNGLLTLASTTGITINTGSDGSSAMNISGTLADINTALDGLQYDPNGDEGAQTITISTDDGNGGTDGPDVGKRLF